jgi:adenylate cyclase, class 2
MPTHREIEIKLRIPDLDEILRKILALGARPRGRVHEFNILFDTPTSGFLRSGRLLRLRIETPATSRVIPAGSGGAWLTSKAPAPPRTKRMRPLFKEKLESELSISNPRQLQRQLTHLGFHTAFRYEKFRTTFRIPRLPAFHIDLDETPLGVILELEGSPASIQSVARRLGFSPREYLRCTYWDLNAAECRRRGLLPRDMLFRA